MAAAARLLGWGVLGLMTLIMGATREGFSLLFSPPSAGWVDVV